MTTADETQQAASASDEENATVEVDSTDDDPKALKALVQELKGELGRTKKTLDKLRRFEKDHKFFEPILDGMYHDLTNGVSEDFLRVLDTLDRRTKWSTLMELKKAKGTAATGDEEGDAAEETSLPAASIPETLKAKPKKSQLENPVNKYNRLKAEKQKELRRPLNPRELDEIRRQVI